MKIRLPQKQNVANEAQAFSLQGHQHKTDQIMLGVIWGLLVYSFALANWYDTWNESLWIGLPSAIVPTIQVYRLAGHLLTRISIAASFMIFSAI